MIFGSTGVGFFAPGSVRLNQPPLKLRRSAEALAKAEPDTTTVLAIIASGLVLFLLSGTLVETASSAAIAASANVSGTVSGTDQGFLTGARVVIDGSPRRETRTDADGRFTFTDVATGRYKLQVTADGYVPLEGNLDVGDAAVSVDIMLLRIPPLP
jgi:hypothetical protein